MHKVLVGGAWVDALSTLRRDVRNPATLEQIGTVPDCGSADVARAAAAARAAQRGWREVAEERRSQYLRRVAADINARARELAALMSQESGKPLCESLDCVASAAAVFERDDGAPGAAAYGKTKPAEVADRHGVLAVIAPFDYPLLWMARAIVPAIARGRTVICLPPPLNPLASLSFATAMQRLPPGVFNMVTGGAETSAALEADGGIDEVDRHFPLFCDSLIVCGDADLEVAVPGVAWARLQNCGQSCASSMRIYVERPIAGAFADALHRYVALLEVGDPCKRDTDLGPLISREAVGRVGDQVAYAVKDGARLKLGGLRFRPWGLPGHFFQPTILTDVPPGSLAAREDIRGPVVPIVPVADAAQAIGGMRDARLGGRTSIYTRNPRIVQRAIETLGAAGDRQSGSVEHVVERRPWWFPYRAGRWCE